MKEAVLLGSYTNTIEKQHSLVKHILEWKQFNLPIILGTHYPVSEYIQNLVDYYIFDREQHLDPTIVVRPTYTNNLYHISINTVPPYHAPAGLIALQHALETIEYKYDFIYYQEYDVALNIGKLLDKIRHSNYSHDLYTFRWFPDIDSITTNVYFFKRGGFNKLWGKMRSTQDYKNLVQENGKNNIIEILAKNIADNKQLWPSIYRFNNDETNELMININEHQGQREFKKETFLFLSSIEGGGAVLFIVNKTPDVLLLTTTTTDLNTNKQENYSTYIVGNLGLFHIIYKKTNIRLDATFGDVKKTYIITDKIIYNECDFNFFDGSVICKK